MSSIGDNQKLIQQILAQVGKSQLVAVQQAKQQKRQQEMARTKLELFLDDLEAEGIEPGSPVGKLILSIYIAKHLDAAEEVPRADFNNF